MKDLFEVFSLLTFILCVLHLESQEIMELYPEGIPNSRSATNEEYSKANDLVDSVTYKVSIPTLKVFHPDTRKDDRSAVIICPGGGYGGLLTKREGSDVAQKLAKNDVTGILLKYRLPDSNIMVHPSIGPLQDLQMAIHTVRQNADEWGINPGKIGVMGFSAGGHLAASSGVLHETFWVDSTQGTDVRPDFMILINPVISFTDEIGHLGSRKNLLGSRVTNKQIEFFSNERNVDASTPPTFLVHNNTDSVVIVENSLLFFKKLREYKIPSEIHIYEKGEHGFLTWPSFDEWFGRVIHWMNGREIK